MRLTTGRALTRALALSTAFTLATVVTAHAQSGPSLPGLWTGPFVTDGPSGNMILEIARDGEAWRVDNTMEGEGVPPKSPIREWKVEGSAFSFAQTFGEYDVFFRGTLEAGTIKGTIEAYQGGSMVGSGSFTLTKQ